MSLGLPMRAVLALAVLACLGAGGDARADELVSRPVVRDRVEKILSDPRFQRAKPEGGELPPPTSPRKLPDFPFDIPTRDFEPSSTSGVSEAVLWVLGGALVLGFVLLLGKEGLRYARRTKRKAVAKPGAPTTDTASLAEAHLPPSLARARELARLGRYDEACHVLLEGAFGFLHALSDFTVEPAFTSREVLAKAPLDAGAQRAFGDLVVAVEVSLFGGLAVVADDFARCEASFLSLSRSLSSDRA